MQSKAFLDLRKWLAQYAGISESVRITSLKIQGSAESPNMHITCGILAVDDKGFVQCGDYGITRNLHEEIISSVPILQIEKPKDDDTTLRVN